MAEVQLSFEERKFVLKCYWKYENVTEVQRQFKEIHQRDAVIACIREKFETTETVQDVHKQRSGRPRSSTSPARGTTAGNSHPIPKEICTES
jgi:hypothetical protein